MSRKVGRTYTLAALAIVLILTGCKSQAKPDYSRPLPPGASALRKLPADQWPDIKNAYRATPGDLSAALRKSFEWFAKPSTQQHFPGPALGIKHDHARASVLAFWDAASKSGSAAEFEQRVRQQFDCYTSVGWNDEGTVLFTGYYSPVFKASAQAAGEFRYPLYKRPADLASEPGGKILGRRIGDQITPFPTRLEIESSPDKAGLAGTELVWLRDKFEVYLIHVQGSAKLQMTDGSVMYVGYAGNNGHDYNSVGREMIKDGVLTKDQLSVPSMWDFFNANPHLLDEYVNRNPRFVFFQVYQPGVWPSGSLGFAVTDFRTLATDKSVYPRAGVVLVNTAIPGPGGGLQQFGQFMLDQDTGGAIRAPGRADIYMGAGRQAEALAGRQYAEGRLYYFFLKPQHATVWMQKLPTVALR